ISLFCISAGALAYEEYGVYRDQRNAVLDIHDSYFKGRKLEEELSQYDWLEGEKTQVQEVATLASEQDFRTMQTYIKRRKKTKVDNFNTTK
ncbi:MAG: hypothetical protein GYB35_17035, partial [Algicola sp.]|nr:hypothetical protein [Algicola sp.]